MLRSITFLLYATIDIWNVWWGLHANQTHTWELAHTNLLVLNLFDYHEIISNWMPNSICQVQIKSNFGLAWFCELNVKKNCSLCMACLRACLYKHTWVYPLVANHVLRHWTTTKKKKERKEWINAMANEEENVYQMFHLYAYWLMLMWSESLYNFFRRLDSLFILV